MRDRDANTAWATASADGVLEERRVYCQNWRGDVSAVITDTGKMVEWVKYSAYGVAMSIPAGDSNSDHAWDATDAAAIGGTLDAREDADLNGALNAADVTQANSITGGYQTLGRTVMTSASVANRKGYAGYENDGSIGDQYHVRYRVYKPTLGRWTRRDPIGYVEGMGLYQYVRGRSVAAFDTFGLKGEICGEEFSFDPECCINSLGGWSGFQYAGACDTCCESSYFGFSDRIAACKEACRSFGLTLDPPSPADPTPDLFPVPPEYMPWPQDPAIPTLPDKAPGRFKIPPLPDGLPGRWLVPDECEIEDVTFPPLMIKFKCSWEF